ncbi:Ras-related protein [Takifugu flavidus]|uniref:Ras-related protein n=1 Tax=Takifugu flavidus TaxID=433684 RepID=A0A5C6NB50_9TELE|nr:Ras-related protein [Takifugu flavidus]
MAAAGASGKTYSFKAVLLGEGCVGKTSLVLRYCENKFNDKHITTLQVRAAGSRLQARLAPSHDRQWVRLLEPCLRRVEEMFGGAAVWPRGTTGAGPGRAGGAGSEATCPQV